MRKIIITLSIITNGFLSIAQGENILQYYESLGLKENPSHKPFSAEEGKKLFFLEKTKSNGDKVGCTTCHTSDPKATGKTRANKTIDPLAPVVNPKRFTEVAQVEKWFQRNCKDVLERPCTNDEKGNFVKYMLSIK
jgi:hypothetical protein